MKLISLLFILFIPTVYADQVLFCDVDMGLSLIDKAYYSPAQVEMILKSCDMLTPDAPKVLLLHGLLARKNKQNDLAIMWLDKAMKAAPQNLSLALELGATYELDNQFNKAGLTYQSILTQSPQNRTAILGLARVYRLEKNYLKAQEIYQALLAQNPQDIDALNGMGWLSAAQNDLPQAMQYFNQTLKTDPGNIEASTALNNIKGSEVMQTSGTQELCETSKGLSLLNQLPVPLSQINMILEHCAANKIENADTYLLQGLLARKEALKLKNYTIAIFWLKKAAALATITNQNANFELATTYEWAGQSKNALTIYQAMLNQSPSNRLALLGKARVLKTLTQFAEAQSIYQQLLDKNSKDVDALNGMGWLELAQKNSVKANQFFKQSLMINAASQEALLGLSSADLQAKQLQMLEQQQKENLATQVLPPNLCNADEGLILINKQNPPLAQVREILARCDKNTPDLDSNLVLHGLLARHLATANGDYEAAIQWFKKAAYHASPGNTIPILELAVTYEWAEDFNKALATYQLILAKNPDNQAALLGKARVLRFSYHIDQSM